MLLVSKLNYRGDWYLFRAKFTNDLNFFVREVGRGSDVLERSLEIAEVLRGRKEMMKTGSRFAHILEKGSGKFISPVF